MGCDIHSFAEVRRNGRWEVVGDVFPFDDWEREHFKRECGHEPFRTRSYAVFGLLAGVRDRTGIPPLSAPKGLPDDVSSSVRSGSESWDADGHSHSWLTVREFLDRGAECIVPRREELPDHFFRHLAVLQALGKPDDVRIVFWFDN